MVVYNNFKDSYPNFLIVECSVIALCDMSEIVIKPIYLPLCATSSFMSIEDLLITKCQQQMTYLYSVQKNVTYMDTISSNNW